MINLVNEQNEDSIVSVYKPRTSPCKQHFVQDDAAMAIKLIAIMSLVAVASSNVGAPAVVGDNVGCGGDVSPAARKVYIFPATIDPIVAPKPEETAETPDAAVTTAYSIHKIVLEKQSLKPPYHYSYGYELFNWKKDFSQRQYESRYGDVGVGTFILRASDGSRSIVDYTVDTPSGFYAVLRKDSQVRPVHFGYSRLAGPLAYASHPAREEYASRTTLIADTGAIENPLVQSAYRTHSIIIDYYEQIAPFNISWGYEVIDSLTGVRRSQYETYYGNAGEGSFTQIDAEGIQSTIDYIMGPEGFSTTPTRTGAGKDMDEVETPILGHAGQ